MVLSLADAELAGVRELLSDLFISMRGSVEDMLPTDWELAPIQSLIGIEQDEMVTQEKNEFVCIDGAVYSKEFTAKAQAMKTVSLGQVKDQCINF